MAESHLIIVEQPPEIVLAEIAKNSREVIRVALGSHKGSATLSIWCWYLFSPSVLRPGKSGLVIGLRHLPALAEALALALATATATGRLPPN